MTKETTDSSRNCLMTHLAHACVLLNSMAACVRLRFGFWLWCMKKLCIYDDHDQRPITEPSTQEAPIAHMMLLQHLCGSHGCLKVRRARTSVASIAHRRCLCRGSQQDETGQHRDPAVACQLLT